VSTPPQDTQPLDLGYAFSEPTVLVTVDDAHPVENTLTLVITNRSGASVEFQNPQGLTPKSELPKWDDSASPLGRVSVWFPWGDASGDLARAGDSTKITASSLVADWAASDRMTDPRLGVYWTLFPLSKAIFLERDQSISFEFTGIVSHIGTGGRVPEQSWMTALPRLPGYTSQQSQTAVWKRELSASLTVPATAIPGDQFEVRWSSAGASYCSLSPGGFDDLPLTGKTLLKMPAKPSEKYTLTAHPASGRPVSDAQTVAAQTGWIDLGPCPAFSWIDGVDAYRVGAEFIAYHTGPGGVWASPDGRTWEQRESLPQLGDDIGATDGTRLWVIGQDPPRAATNQTAVIASTTDGRSWSTHRGAPFDGLQYPAAVWFQNALWVLGGWRWVGRDDPDNKAIWYSTDGGASWQDAPPAPWPDRLELGQVAVFANRLWAVVAGRHLWATANGREWTAQQPVPWPGSTEMQTLVGTDDALYGMGADTKVNKNVLWGMERDQTWTQHDVTPALSFGIRPGVARYGSGLLAVGTRAFRWVPPVTGKEPA
jgi:hypothetical protein